MYRLSRAIINRHEGYIFNLRIFPRMKEILSMLWFKNNEFKKSSIVKEFSISSSSSSSRLIFKNKIFKIVFYFTRG